MSSQHEDCGNYERGQPMRAGWCYPCWKRIHGTKSTGAVEAAADGACCNGAAKQATINFVQPKAREAGKMKLFVAGYPHDVGGAGTELWHTIKLWRKHGIEVELIPTWGLPESHWVQRLHSLGCATHVIRPEGLEERLGNIPGLAGSPVVSFCNGNFCLNAHHFRKLGCPVIWVNCMNWIGGPEKTAYLADPRPFDAYVFQSLFQAQTLEPELRKVCDYTPARGFFVRGAFDLEGWPWDPLPHEKGKPFVMGRMSRPDGDKWSSSTWKIYEQVNYPHKIASMLGMNEQTHAKLGKAPDWAQCHRPGAMPVQQFLSELHCLLPINGGAKENWPRAGLEAMAAGVPVVAQNDWGWREMIEHGRTGFLATSDEELAHYAGMLAWDETLRLKIAWNARQRMEEEFANPARLWSGWEKVFAAVSMEVGRG